MSAYTVVSAVGTSSQDQGTQVKFAVKADEGIREASVAPTTKPKKASPASSVKKSKKAKR
jgi:hypothetical protein